MIHKQRHLIGNDFDHAPGGFYAGDDSLTPAGTSIDNEAEQISEATKRWNKIADDMWRQYQEVLHQQSLATNELEESNEDSDEGCDGESDDDFYTWLKQQTIYNLQLHLHTKGKKNAIVTYIVPILSEFTYHEPLQEQVHEKQLLY